MKRGRDGAPTMIVHRWNRLPLSCRACREKKRRCDRKQPCANCSLRNLRCDYTDNTGDGHPIIERGERIPAPPASIEQANSRSPVALASPDQPAPSSGELLARIRRLEEAVFNQTSETNPYQSPRKRNLDFCSFQDISQKIYTPKDLVVEDASRLLPPVEEANILFDQFTKNLHPTSCFLHIPSTYEILQESYKSLQSGTAIDPETLLLLFSIFSGAALAWTRPMLRKLCTTKAECKIAFANYSQVALSILEDAESPLPPTTISLAGTANLAVVFVNGHGFSHKLSALRSRCLLTARLLQLHRLDTAKAREERQRNGCNMIELEVQRRIWWHMVADDWLMSFAGGPFDGIYSFHPKHMNVDYPKNADDHHITASMPGPDLPLSTPTAMSTFLARVRFATLCREIVDVMGPTLLEGNEPEYSVVLEIGQQLQDHLDELPHFLRLDPESIRISQDVCAQRPDLVLQRLATNFSIHARICRLHRLYHLEGSLNPEYAYSRTMCIRSAHRVLELRRAMDQVGAEAGCHPARFWKITQHVFLAALTLATDVSINPEGPDAEDRKAKVMAAYKTLESSKEDSITLVETIQKNLQALMTTFESRRTANPLSLRRAQIAKRRPETVIAQRSVSQHPPQLEPIGSEVSFEPGLDSMNQGIPISVDGSVSAMDSSSSGVDHLWDDFWAVAPELEATDWNMLLEDMYTDWEPNVQ